MASDETLSQISDILQNCEVKVVYQYPMWMLVVCVIAFSFVSAGVIYYIGSRGFGTPLNDSLSKNQRHLKQKSSGRRASLFGGAFAMSLLVFALIAFFMMQS